MSSADCNCIQKDQSVFSFPDLSHKTRTTIYHPRQQLLMLPVNERKKQTQKFLNKSNFFVCVAQTSYLQFRAMQRAARLVPLIALWAVLNFTEEGGGKGR